MAVPKQMLAECMVNIACDGNRLQPKSTVCSECKKALKKRKAMQTRNERILKATPGFSSDAKKS